MADNHTFLISSKYYHIYKHTIGFESIFLEERNYFFFLEKYQLYVSPIVDTLAYCLMLNHFHLLIRIKGEEELKKQVVGNSQGITGLKARQNLESLRAEIDDEKLYKYNKYISQCFSNLFNSYTKSFNKVYRRRGSLFVPSFKRKEIISLNYLRQVIVYIHNNPVKHGFVKKPELWPHSSYTTYKHNEETFLHKSFVLTLFDTVEDFEAVHYKRIRLSTTYLLE